MTVLLSAAISFVAFVLAFQLVSFDLNGVSVYLFQSSIPSIHTQVMNMFHMISIESSSAYSKSGEEKHGFRYALLQCLAVVVAALLPLVEFLYLFSLV